MESNDPVFLADMQMELRCPRCGHGLTDESFVRRDGSRHAVFVCYEEVGCFTHYDVWESGPQ